MRPHNRGRPHNQSRHRSPSHNQVRSCNQARSHNRGRSHHQSRRRRLIRHTATLSPTTSRPRSKTMQPMNYSKYRTRAGYTRFRGGIGSAASALWIAVTGVVMRYFSTAVPLSMALCLSDRQLWHSSLCRFRTNGRSRLATAALSPCIEGTIFSPAKRLLLSRINTTQTAASADRH